MKYKAKGIMMPPNMTTYDMWEQQWLDDTTDTFYAYDKTASGKEHGKVNKKDGKFVVLKPENR